MSWCNDNGKLVKLSQKEESEIAQKYIDRLEKDKEYFKKQGKVYNPKTGLYEKAGD